MFLTFFFVFRFYLIVDSLNIYVYVNVRYTLLKSTMCLFFYLLIEIKIVLLLLCFLC